MKAYLEIEMPTSCYYCPMTNDGFYLCKATSPFKELEDDCEECKPQWCPIVPISPHGDLIGREALRAEVKKHATPSDAWVFSLIRTAPTIIPASEEGEK